MVNFKITMLSSIGQDFCFFFVCFETGSLYIALASGIHYLYRQVWPQTHKDLPASLS